MSRRTFDQVRAEERERCAAYADGFAARAARIEARGGAGKLTADRAADIAVSFTAFAQDLRTGLHIDEAPAGDGESGA